LSEQTKLFIKKWKGEEESPFIDFVRIMFFTQKRNICDITAVIYWTTVYNLRVGKLKDGKCVAQILFFVDYR
jgi:hypothetical protein